MKQYSTKKLTDKTIKKVYTFLVNYKGYNQFIFDLSNLVKEGKTLSDKQIRATLRFMKPKMTIYRANIK